MFRKKDETQHICPDCGTILTLHSSGTDGEYDIEYLCPRCEYKLQFAHMESIGKTTIVDFKGVPMKIKITKLTDTAIIPTRGSDQAAGYDLYADTTEDITVQPGEMYPFQTGIAMEIPEGYFGAIYARSGIATKRGLRPPNCVGVIDSDYRGNIGVGLINDSDKPQVIKAHERVAQIVIQPYINIEFEEVESLSETDRGANGFGSTGRK